MFAAVRRHAPLLLAAIFVLTVAVIRISIQQITIDEADSYLVWADRDYPSHWEASSNNHVLNSVLMRLATMVFGPSNLTVRASALLGSFIYIAAALVLCLRLTRRLRLALPLFVCLTLNPFVLDHLVAARGYSLAMGFLMLGFCAVALVLGRDTLSLSSSARLIAVSSALAGLCISANFAFAFAAVSMLTAAFVWSCIWAFRDGLRKWTAYAKLIAAAALPGVIIIASISLPAILRMPKGELWYGSQSLRMMISGLIEASLYRPNPNVANPIVLRFLRLLGHVLVPAYLFTCCFQAIAWAIDRNSKRTLASSLALFLTVTIGQSLALHLAARYCCGLLLPKDRTGLFFIPMAILLAGALSAVSVRSMTAAAGGTALNIVLVLLSVYHVGCLRLTYFKEWYWNSDSQQIYSILAGYNHRYGVKDVATTWKCASVLNYYRVASGHETFDEFQGVAEAPFPPGKSIYVLDYPYDQSVIEANHLKIVYLGKMSEIAVALDPQAFRAGRN